ncbi:hypothetical protein IP90_02090 [Luteimonas cucumeris]|uniref:Uncharacterized protein n=1 Tax=Luteimonas cucumeris TaxID=985012 RepID=A0A562L5S8_9GAMM|nr:hypothetical protein [Luteimonas cucumeris]TWI02988.1 hypothetical protein IP90_02090 [Luteimonas cucumeris]
MIRPLLMIAFAALLAVAGTARAADDDADVARLNQRLQQLDDNLSLAGMASYERLQARQAIERVATARSRDRANALYVADRRVETAEIAARIEQGRREVDRLERERSEMLVEASRREAERARREAEHLRIQTQIHAEEAEHLRLAAEQEAAARQQAEGVLNDVAGAQAAKLRAARKRQAELARREAELMSAGGNVDKPESKSSKP